MSHRTGALLNAMAAVFVLFVAMVDPPISAAVAATLLLSLGIWSMFQPPSEANSGR